MRVLPATQTLGTLSHRTLVLELPTFRASEVEEALNGARECEPARILSHEMTHWYDIVGTVWGQDYLDSLFQAYDTVLQHSWPRIEAFPSALRQFDAERAILFPTYFKVVNAAAKPYDGPGRWRMDSSTGVRFRQDGTLNEDDPILFIRFFDGAEFVARQPISVGALLELRALGAEIQAYRDLKDLRPADEGLVEQLLFQRASLQILYDPELTTYSAAAHLLSLAGLGVFDADIVMIMGPRIADYALNVTPNLFRRLTTPRGLDDGNMRRQRAFRERADRGYLFGCLCFHLSELGSALRNGGDIDDLLLNQAGLPTVEGLYDAATRFVTTRRPSQLVNRDLRRIRTALQGAGLEIMASRRNLAGLTAKHWAALPGPRILDHDAETFHAGRETLSEKDADFLNDCSTTLDELIRPALRAVRGLEFRFTDFVY